MNFGRAVTAVMNILFDDVGDQGQPFHQEESRQ
jgi:hypothetical protein